MNLLTAQSVTVMFTLEAKRVKASPRDNGGAVSGGADGGEACSAGKRHGVRRGCHVSALSLELASSSGPLLLFSRCYAIY